MQADFVGEGLVSGFRVRVYKDGPDGVVFVLERSWLKAGFPVPLGDVRGLLRALREGESYWGSWSRGGERFVVNWCGSGGELWVASGPSRLRLDVELGLVLWGEDREAFIRLLEAVVAGLGEGSSGVQG